MGNTPPTCAGCDSDDMLCSCVESMNATYHRMLDEREQLERNLPCPEDCGERNTTASSEPNHCYLAEMTRC